MPPTEFAETYSALAGSLCLVTGGAAAVAGGVVAGGGDGSAQCAEHRRTIRMSTGRRSA